MTCPPQPPPPGIEAKLQSGHDVALGHQCSPSPPSVQLFTDPERFGLPSRLDSAQTSRRPGPRTRSSPLATSFPDGITTSRSAAGVSIHPSSAIIQTAALARSAQGSEPRRTTRVPASCNVGVMNARDHRTLRSKTADPNPAAKPAYLTHLTRATTTHRSTHASTATSAWRTMIGLPSAPAAPRSSSALAQSRDGLIACEPDGEQTSIPPRSSRPVRSNLDTRSADARPPNHHLAPINSCSERHLWRASTAASATLQSESKHGLSAHEDPGPFPFARAFLSHRRFNRKGPSTRRDFSPRWRAPAATARARMPFHPWEDLLRADHPSAAHPEQRSFGLGREPRPSMRPQSARPVNDDLPPQPPRPGIEAVLQSDHDAAWGH
jgi:hypothetical protein